MGKPDKQEVKCDGGVAYKDTSNPLYYIPRGVKLYSDRFVTFHEDDPADHKTWRLYPESRLEPESSSNITECHKLVRPAKTSTLRAVWSGRGKEIDLVRGAGAAGGGAAAPSRQEVLHRSTQCRRLQPPSPGYAAPGGSNAGDRRLPRAAWRPQCCNALSDRRRCSSASRW
jgi:hypothetical protein